jgi:hypothetical protein
MNQSDPTKAGTGAPSPRSLFARSLRALLALGLATFGAAVFAAAKRDTAEVVANAELTEEGKLLPRPTPEQPVYYVPVIHGWNEIGKIVAGEEPPKRVDVLRQLAQALAKEGYILQALRPDANTTMPSLIIHIAWGYMNPDVVETGALDLSNGEGGTMSASMPNDPTQATSVDFNVRDMVTLVVGSKPGRLTALTQTDSEKVGVAVAEDRYFVIVSAYDFASSLKGEQKLLWCARMSTARQGVWMQDVVPALVTTGASLFGRESDLPTWKAYPVREGRVDLGELQVLDADVKVPAEKKP